MSRSDDETVVDPTGDGGPDLDRLLDAALGAAFSRGSAAAASPGPLPPGASLAGRYRILRELGRGGMGEVVLARDGSLERDVALKRMRPEQRDNVKARARFIREAVIAGQLQHPGVVPLYELGHDADGSVFLTMRPIEGATLAARLKTRPSVTHELPAMLRAFEQVCQTMAYAHARSVIHRDLKPDNIMLGAYGEVQILDWGLAKALGGPPDEAAPGSPADAFSPGPDNLSVDGAVLGTPLYMAPEQAIGDLAAVDARTDVFSLGAILCEILTGQPLYAAKDATTAITRAALADLTDANERLERAPVDPALKDLTRDCLRPEKTGRPANAGEVAARLGAYLAGVEERARAAAVAAAEARERAHGERRSRRLVTALAATLIVLIAGAGAVAWHRADARRAADREAEGLLLESAARVAREDWAAAEDLAARALVALDRGGGDPGLREQATAQASRTREGRERRRLLDRLEQVRLRSGGPPHEVVGGYTAAFAEAGLDFGASPEELGRAVGARDPAVREGLIQALDDCASRIPPHEENMQATWRRVVEAASAADANEWRRRLRAAILTGDDATIRAMARTAASEPLPPQGYLVLGQALHNVSRDPALESRILMEGVGRFPGDYWINFTIAHRCLPGRDPLPGGVERAERHARVAVALRPDNPDARAILGVALLARAERSAERSELLQESRGWLESSLERMPDDGPKHAVRSALLMAEGRQEEARRLLRDDGRPPPPWMRGLMGAPSDGRRPPPRDR